LKLQVTKQDLKSRAHYQEVAEFFEELLQATEKGLDYLPPRLNRAPGQVDNEAKRQRQAAIDKEREGKEVREAKRVFRQENLKHTIEDTNYGGRGMPTREFKKEEKKTKKVEDEAKGKEDRKKFIAEQKDKAAEIEEQKKKSLDELKKKKKAEQDKAEATKKETEVERKQKMREPKEKLEQDFENTYKRRDMLIEKKKKAEELERSNIKKLKTQMDAMIKETKGDREQEKAENL
jgi:hypothetical protein